MTGYSQGTVDVPLTEPLGALDPDSYTVHRLRHATPEHLHLTTRRCFIGPIPEGWLKSHRRDWYKRHLHINYSSRSTSFSAQPNTGKHRRLTGIDGPSATAAYGHSFPQPEDVIAEEEEENQDAEQRAQAGAVLDEPPAVDVPRTDEPPHTSGQEAVPQEMENDTTNTFTSPLTKAALPPTKTASEQANRPPRKPRKGLFKQATKQAAKQDDAKRVNDAATGQTSNSAAQADDVREGQRGEMGRDGREARAESYQGSSEPRSSAGWTDGDPSSSTSLLRQDHANEDGEDSAKPKGILAKIKSKSSQQQDGSAEEYRQETEESRQKIAAQSGLVRFNLPDDDATKEQVVKVRLAQLRKRNTLKNIRKSKVNDGTIIKMEKMLVRIEFSTHELAHDFDENDSQKIESRAVEKWREFMIVCRESTGEKADYILQMYKTRVIPAVERTNVKHKSTHEIPLSVTNVKVNIFSSLDKTIVLWTPTRKGTNIFIMKPRSGSNSMEWFTFIRNLLGGNRPSRLQVNVPDLEVSLRIDDPFSKVESSRDIAQAAEGDEEALLRTMQEEQAAASSIVERCVGMLEKSPEWSDVIHAWAAPSEAAISTGQVSHGVDHQTNATSQGQAQTPIGLAWKRYDRLEWVHGANEKKMYGTMGMDRTHELELRPKQHYPTAVIGKKGKTLVEPAPVEGFLVRLTSQRGVDRRLGKLFFKRLYFSTHSQYLVFNRPSNADPPPPPKLPMQTNKKIPTSHQIADKVPLIFSVNPFPLENGHVKWLSTNEAAAMDKLLNHDADAYDENERKDTLLLKCDGSIDLCDVERVRDVVRGAAEADQNLDEGSDVDFDQSVQHTREDDGTIPGFDDERTFELVVKNGLVIRLQAFDKITKDEWKKRLHALIRYWKLRVAADIALYKSVRQQNLERFGIDEDTEAFLGQYGRKWEVSKSFASAELYHMCGISCCRAVHLAGTLFRKTRYRASFARCMAILSHGHLLVFSDSVRSRSGKLLPSTHNERVSNMDLRDCYVYSGLITENDLLYTDRGFDNTRPGHHAVPRMYLEDGWTSTDEDTMTTFVIWHGKRKSWFRSEKTANEGARKRVKLVSRLGVAGRGIVFKTRSRAERDHWVLNIGMEIERLSQDEEFRIVGESGMK